MTARKSLEVLPVNEAETLSHRLERGESFPPSPAPKPEVATDVEAKPAPERDEGLRVPQGMTAARYAYGSGGRETRIRLSRTVTTARVSNA